MGRKSRMETVLEEAARPADACVLWSGRTDDGGYGVLSSWRGRRNLYVHRVAYEELVGPIAEGMTVDHLCFQTACVNPRHLTVASPKENRERQRSALRTHCVNGHAFTEENTYHRPHRYRNGKRQCRTCNREAVRAYTQRRRERALVPADGAA